MSANAFNSGSSDSLYNSHVSDVRKMARTVGFKHSVPAVPGAEPDTYWLQLVYPKGEEVQAEAQLKKLIEWLQNQKQVQYIEHIHFPKSRSKISAAYGICFRVVV